MKSDRLVLVLTICLLGGGLIGATTPAASRKHDSPFVGVRSFPQKQQSEAFWRTAMKRAEPLDPRRGTRGLEGSSALDAVGAPVVVPPTGPEGASHDSLPKYVSYAGRKGEDLYPAISFSSSEIADPRKAPSRRHGTLFFTNGGETYRCSGTIVTATNESVVATAGHCVFDAEFDRPNTSTMFIPGYKAGEMPFGVWDATQVLTPEPWTDGGDLRYDVGMLVIERHRGRTIQDVLGSRGISFRQVPRQLIDAYGYPAEEPFDGEQLFHCVSEASYTDPAFSDPAPSAIGCNMTSGASGGGWLIQTRQGGVVNSITSYLYPSQPGLLFGPYFGNVAEALYNAAAGNAGGPTPGTSPSSLPADNGPIKHASTLTLKFDGHLRAKGSLTPLDGFLRCGRGAPVGIYRVVDEVNGRLVGGMHKTGPSQRYGAWIPDRQGRYFANVFRRDLNKKHRCARAQSGVVSHRH